MAVPDDAFIELSALFMSFASFETVTPKERLKIFYLAATGLDSHKVALQMHPLVHGEDLDKTIKRVLKALSHLVNLKFLEKKHLGAVCLQL